MAKKHYTKSSGNAKAGIARVVAVILGLLAIAYVITSLALGGIWNPVKWVKKAPTVNENEYVISARALSEGEFAAYGISPQAIKAGVLTVNYEPVDATNNRTNFTYKFAQNAWSEGKNLADYVTFTPGTNHAPNCTYEVLQPFGATIVVEATSLANPELKAQTNIDYLARYNTFWQDGNVHYLGADNMVNIFLDFTSNEVYSIRPTSYSADIEVTPNQSFNDWLKTTDHGGCTENTKYTKTGVTGAFDLSEALKLFQIDSPVGAYVAPYWAEVGGEEQFVVSATITCYYEGKEYYTFSGTGCFGYLEEVIDSWTIAGTAIKFAPNSTHIVV